MTGTTLTEQAEAQGLLPNTTVRQEPALLEAAQLHREEPLHTEVQELELAVTVHIEALLLEAAPTDLQEQAEAVPAEAPIEVLAALQVARALTEAQEVQAGLHRGQALDLLDQGHHQVEETKSKITK